MMTSVPHPLIVPDLAAGALDPTFVWPGLTQTCQFWLEQGEQIIWRGTADITGMRHVSGTVEGDPRRAAWNIQGFAECVVTDRRIVYRGDGLSSGRPWRFNDSPVVGQSSAQGVVLPRSVLGHVRFEWIHSLVVRSVRAFAVLPVGAVTIICIDDVTVVRLQFVLMPGAGSISTASSAVRVTQHIAQLAAAARLRPSNSRLTAEQVARLTAASAGPDVHDNGAHTWELPGAIPIGQRPALAVDSGAVMSRDASHHFERYQKGGNIADLDRSIGLYRTATNLLATSANLRPHLSNFAHALHQRYDLIGREPDLYEAIAVCEEALALTDKLDPNRPEELYALANLVSHRAERIHSGDDFDYAIQLYREAIAAVPKDSRWLVDLHGRLGSGLRKRFERTGTPGDIHEAISACRISLGLAQAQDGGIVGEQKTLAEALIVRFHHSGVMSDGKEAEVLLRAAAAASELDDSSVADLLSALGTVLFYQFEQASEMENLAEAISVWRESVSRTGPDDARGIFVRFSNLANGLVRRYTRLHDETDLNEAISLYRLALSAAKPGSIETPTLLTNLAGALEDRWDLGGKAEDLDEAIALSKAAVEATPHGNISRPGRVNALSQRMRSRFQLTRSVDDLDTAIEHARAAAEAGGIGESARLHNVFGVMMFDRYSVSNERVDLETSSDLFEQALVKADGLPSERAMILYNLGNTLNARYLLTGNSTDVVQAKQCWADSASTPVADTSIRLAAARKWATACASAGQFTESLNGYATALDMIPRLGWRGIDPQARQRLLASWRGLACDAAAAALAAGQPELAVEYLEAGRGVMFAQMLQLHTDLDSVRSAAPDLAKRLEDAASMLDRANAFDMSQAGALGATMAHDKSTKGGVDDRMRAADRWDALVTEIRNLPGHSEFLRPAKFKELAKICDGRKVAIINISKWRCDVLLIVDGQLKTLPLPHLTQDLVEAKIDDYLDSLQNSEATFRGAIDERAITSILDWLWRTIAQPVLETLGHNEQHMAGAWPRVWWCPTGRLALLPIHAATSNGAQPGTACLDRVVSSYTPTLRALRPSSPKTQPLSIDTMHPIIVAMRRTPGMSDLPGVTTEVKVLQRLFTTPLLLSDKEATVRQTRQALATRNIAHISCHGRQRLADPLSGGLHLHDGLLSIDDIIHSRRAPGEFVFLSACKTATGGYSAADEAISVASALHYSGWQNVIGTMWSVWDTAAANITRDVYSRLLASGVMQADESAEALHNAVRRQRASTPHRPSMWAQFIHLGP